MKSDSGSAPAMERPTPLVNGPSDFDRAHIEDLIAGRGDWFSAQLLRLCAKADTSNLERLRLGFPEHVAAYLEWHSPPRNDDLGVLGRCSHGVDLDRAFCPQGCRV